MENRSSSASNEQALSEELSYVPDPPPASVPVVSQSLSSQASSSEVSQALFIPPQDTDPRRETARKGLVWGIVSISAFLIYMASFFAPFLNPSLGAFTGVPICGSLIIAVIAPLIGIVSSLRGLKSTTKRGQAMAGLLLSLVPLIILLSFFGLVAMFVWSNDQ